MASFMIKNTYEPIKIFQNNVDLENTFLEKKNIINHDSSMISVYTAEDFKGHKGRTIVEHVTGYAVSNVRLRSELKHLIYAIIEDDQLLNFFMFTTPPKETGYVLWDCPEMSKVKTLFTSDDETMFTFGFKCRALHMFFSNTRTFYEVFSQQ